MMILFTAVNAIIRLFGSLYIFPYAAYTPQLTSLFVRMLYLKYGFNGAEVYWILIGLSLITLYLYARKIAVATRKLILYHLLTAYQEFKKHPEAVEIPKVKHK